MAVWAGASTVGKAWGCCGGRSQPPGRGRMPAGRTSAGPARPGRACSMRRTFGGRTRPVLLAMTYGQVPWFDDRLGLPGAWRCFLPTRPAILTGSRHLDRLTWAPRCRLGSPELERAPARLPAASLVRDWRSSWFMRVHVVLPNRVRRLALPEERAASFRPDHGPGAARRRAERSRCCGFDRLWQPRHAPAI